MSTRALEMLEWWRSTPQLQAKTQEYCRSCRDRAQEDGMKTGDPTSELGGLSSGGCQNSLLIRSSCACGLLGTPAGDANCLSEPPPLPLQGQGAVDAVVHLLVKVFILLLQVGLQLCRPGQEGKKRALQSGQSRLPQQKLVLVSIFFGEMAASSTQARRRRTA